MYSSTHSGRMRRYLPSLIERSSPVATPVRPGREHDTTCLRTHPGLLDALPDIRGDLRTRPRDLRRRGRLPKRLNQHPGAAAEQARPVTPRRAGHDPVDRPRGQTTTLGLIAAPEPP